jgi:hypothetical protein
MTVVPLVDGREELSGAANEFFLFPLPDNDVCEIILREEVGALARVNIVPGLPKAQLVLDLYQIRCIQRDGGMI